MPSPVRAVAPPLASTGAARTASALGRAKTNAAARANITAMPATTGTRRDRREADGDASREMRNRVRSGGEPDDMRSLEEVPVGGRAGERRTVGADPASVKARRTFGSARSGGVSRSDADRLERAPRRHGMFGSAARNVWIGRAAGP